jgi:UDP-N-acetylmuramate dehydrogenase
MPAGWLIETAGWKGKTISKNEGNSEAKYGVHKNQALVLVNYGGATGTEIFDLSTNILKSISNEFGVDLEREVNII